jgi:GT2 family glycosyltransferase
MIPIPTIAVLLTCHNRKEKTLQCLQALFSQQGLGTDFFVEVFLVDDASTDGTTRAIQIQFPLVSIIQGDGNLFWNRGMRLAWQTAARVKEFDYYLWLNDDTFLFDHAIKILLSGAQLSDFKSAICGSTFSLEKNAISYGGFSNDKIMMMPNDKLQQAYMFNGNCVLIPKYVFNRVGLLDKRFPHAIGDFEYALRIRKNNLDSFISEGYIGTCEGNEKLPLWCSPSAALNQRIKNLYSPLGNSHPYYYFIFEYQYFGILTSLKHYLTIHLRLLFPNLWIRKNRLFSK